MGRKRNATTYSSGSGATERATAYGRRSSGTQPPAWSRGSGDRAGTPLPLDQHFLEVVGAVVQNPFTRVAELPGVRRVREREVQEVAHLGDVVLARHLDQHLDAPVEIAVHEVGRADPHARLPTVLEPVDPAVLEETPDDRPDADVLRHAGYPRAQSADAAHDHLDGHARLRGEVERVDAGLVHHRVGLDPDAR